MKDNGIDELQAIAGDDTNQIRKEDIPVKGTGSTTLEMHPNIAGLYNKLMYGSASYYDTYQGKFLELGEFNKKLLGSDESRNVLGAVDSLIGESPFGVKKSSDTHDLYGRKLTGYKQYPGSSYFVDPSGITNLISQALTQSKKVLDESKYDKGPIDFAHARQILNQVGMQVQNSFLEGDTVDAILRQYFKRIVGDVKSSITDLSADGSLKNLNAFTGVAKNSLKDFFDSDIANNFINLIGNLDKKEESLDQTISGLRSWLLGLPRLIDSTANTIMKKSFDILQEDYIQKATIDFQNQIQERYTITKGKMKSSLVAQNASTSAALLIVDRMVEKDKNLEISKFQTDLKLKSIELFAGIQAQILNNYNSNFVPFYQSNLEAETQLTSMIGLFFDAYMRVMLANADYLQSQIDTHMQSTASVYGGYNQIVGNYFSGQQMAEQQMLSNIVNYLIQNKDNYTDRAFQYYSGILNEHYNNTYGLYGDFYTKATQYHVSDLNWNLEALGKGVQLLSTMNGAMSPTVDAMPKWAMQLQSISAITSSVASLAGGIVSAFI